MSEDSEIIQGTQFDDDILIHNASLNVTSTVATTSGSAKTRKLAKRQFDEEADYAHFAYAGEGNDRVYGSEDKDAIDGGNGDDLIYGSKGDDLLVGGNGKDTIVGGSGDDLIGSAASSYGGSSDNGGDLLIGDGQDVALDKTTGLTTKNLTDPLTDFGEDHIFGGNAKDEIWGDNRDNNTDGAADMLFGNNGDDIIHGGGGNDEIEGGNGADQLWGGAGNDVFGYESVAESNAGSFDTIHDFDETTDGDHDVIDLEAFGGDLTFGGTTKTTHGVWYEIVPGYTFVYADTDGNGEADLTIRLVGEKDLTADDFKGVVGGDTTPPDAPVITSISDDTGSSDTDEITKDNTLVIYGTAEANSTVEVFKDGASIGTTTAGADGKWNFSYVGTTLADGEYNFTATATDAANNTSDLSAALHVTIDTAAAAPSAPDLDAASDSGTKNDDNITNDKSPTVSGNGAEAGATVKLYDTDGTTVLGTTVAAGDGSWSITSSDLLDGKHTLTVKQTDIAGNTSAASGSLEVTIDTDADVDDNLKVLINDGDGYINDAEKAAVSYTVSGVDADAMATVTFTSSGGGVPVVVNSLGNQTTTVDLSSLPNGTITATVSVTDTAGNTASGTSDTSILDVSPPSELDFAFVSDPGIVTDAGVVGAGITLGKFVGTDNLTVNPDFTFEIRQVRTATANSAVFGAADTTSPFPPFTIDTANDLLVATTALLANTNYEITIRVTDQAGNFSDEIINVVTGIGSADGSADDPFKDQTAETLSTLDDDDVLFGLNGSDMMFGFSGDDTLFGDAGSDALHGGSGNDTLIGGAGMDTMDLSDTTGGIGVNFTFDSGAGLHVADLTSAGLGIDTYEGIEQVLGTNFDDTIGGGDANDVILGGGGNDTLSGGIGADTISGGAGNDTANGDAGNDAVNGGGGNDTINGGADNDLLDGGLGNDTVNGDAGNDKLIYGAGDTYDGGTGFDVLENTAVSSFTYDGAGAGAFVTGVEMVSLGDNNHNGSNRTVVINAADVLDGVDVDVGVSGHSVDLFVIGDEASGAVDTVDLNGFSAVDLNGGAAGNGTFDFKDANTNVTHTYALYSNGTIEVAVESGMTVS